MSQIKNKILKLIDNSKIDGRYRTILALYQNNPEYAKLAYHNVDHVIAVLNLFEVLRKLSGKGWSKDQLKAAELAIAFHDINHTGHPDSREDEKGFTNIHHAIAVFNGWALENRLPRTVHVEAADIIEATAYPPVPTTAARYGASVDTELLNLVRDADMLWGMVPGNAEQCMLGLWAERRNAGLEPDTIDIFKVLTNQIKFIQNYQPLSAAGRTFKNAMTDDANTAWSLVAIQYQRQIMAAEMVSQMTDDEVLRLAAAMKLPLREQMAPAAAPVELPTVQDDGAEPPEKAQD